MLVCCKASCMFTWIALHCSTHEISPSSLKVQGKESTYTTTTDRIWQKQPADASVTIKCTRLQAHSCFLSHNSQILSSLHTQERGRAIQNDQLSKFGVFGAVRQKPTFSQYYEQLCTGDRAQCCVVFLHQAWSLYSMPTIQVQWQLSLLSSTFGQLVARKHIYDTYNSQQSS